MKKNLLSVLAVFALVGSASASDINYQAVKKVFNWSGAGPAAAGAVVPVQRFETRVLVTQEYAQCRPMSCAAALPGRFDAWQGLFTASERDRPIILSRVLRGLPVEMAALIVQSGFLRRMPPNWQALQTELMNAQNQLYAQGSYFNFMSAVFEVNGLANAVALGYADANACVAAPTYSCSAPSMKRETRPIGALNRNVRFDVSGALLLPYEMESVAIQIGGPGQPPVVMSNDFDTRLTNQYEMRYDEDPSTGDLSIALRFINRPMRAAPSNLIVTNNLAKAGNGDLTLTVALDPNKIVSLLGRGGKLELQHSLCRRDLLGGCAETVVSPVIADITSGTLKVTYPAAVLKNKKYHAAVQLRAVGTPYFSNDLGDKEKSNKVDND